MKTLIVLRIKKVWEILIKFFISVELKKKKCLPEYNLGFYSFPNLWLHLKSWEY